MRRGEEGEERRNSYQDPYLAFHLVAKFTLRDCYFDDPTPWRPILHGFMAYKIVVEDNYVYMPYHLLLRREPQLLDTSLFYFRAVLYVTIRNNDVRGGWYYPLRRQLPSVCDSIGTAFAFEYVYSIDFESNRVQYFYEGLLARVYSVLRVKDNYFYQNYHHNKLEFPITPEHLTSIHDNQFHHGLGHDIYLNRSASPFHYIDIYSNQFLVVLSKRCLPRTYNIFQNQSVWWFEYAPDRRNDYEPISTLNVTYNEFTYLRYPEEELMEFIEDIFPVVHPLLDPPPGRQRERHKKCD